ncbi:SMP-30/gluconolactonase/LRE family protein [Williamsia maris]|uniref:SMP-30/gluconolactonase/LRE family protein n=1 Tax=Williamsia maris TaxID=72806 RepID=UPI0020A3AB08|nr:SMP-30/gluconolactonase/LRE family protein [Williamsia maris]
MKTAKRLVQVSKGHGTAGNALLEGPTFGPDGRLYLVDVTAPAGAPKLMRVDVETKKVEPVYTDSTSGYTSAQFSPVDGRIYLTDVVEGTIDSINADGTDHRTFYAGDVNGKRMMPDDLTFDNDGTMFVTDIIGLLDPVSPPQGRVIRIDKNGAATVIADQLESPNGISFDTDVRSLWVSQYGANRIDHYELNQDRTAIAARHPAIYYDGGISQIDSTAVDADGNIYQALHRRPAIVVFNKFGEHLTTIEIPEADAKGLDTATNIAVIPGNTKAYMTVSGRDGGYVYTFDTLAKGLRQTNGG